MLVQIVNFILDVITGMVGGACLLRLVMQWQRVPFNNPVGRFIFAITDWVVMPLRRALPALGGVDLSPLALLLLLQIAGMLLSSLRFS